ncbi:MAG: D-cysteine desulfhydrase family protein [Rhodocyclaceae bacterium]|jgi:L-cysteate sulfo-lyase|nr:D-cysteine desulfhydrase [Rhodocyclaceae bacterium]MBZ0142700.1 D-cysteine desulfhydrase family protein [Rhodocyclaceae bacterium]MCL4682961.1 D-cysteine desulfhydrase family protein [Rhodocyclaceae bacterium]
MDLTRFPRVSLTRLPTPIEPLPRLSAHMGGPRLFVKRDDLTGLGLGGNKLRKLEFLLGEALAQGADTVLTVGALQSNHARQTAAACARLGLDCELVLRRGSHASEAYLNSGNLLLDRLFGARLHLLQAQESREERMEARAEDLRAAGRRPYCVPVGGSCGLGDLGYVACAEEIIAQSEDMNVRFDAVVVATGSGGTQGGLVAGMRLLEGAPVIGMAVEGTRAEQEALAAAQAMETLHLLGRDAADLGSSVAVMDDFVGSGYAKPTDSMREALSLAARFEGLVLDPVYTGKAFAGLIALARSGRFNNDQSLLFVHTGGVPGLFGYPESV